MRVDRMSETQLTGNHYKPKSNRRRKCGSCGHWHGCTSDETAICGVSKQWKPRNREACRMYITKAEMAKRAKRRLV